MTRFIIGGEEVPAKDLAGEAEVSTTITVEDEDGGTLKKTISGSITLYGRAWEIVKAELIDPADGRMREVTVKLLDDCTTPPTVVFDGVFQGDTVDWCEGECSCTVTAIEKTVNSAAVDCIKSTLIYDNHNGIQSEDHPRMVYCDELRPEWLHHVVLISGIILMLLLDLLIPVVAILTVIVTVINAIISAINVLPGVNIDQIDFDGNSATSLLAEYINLRNQIREVIIGCGRKHPSPLIRRYILNVCQKCGLAFQSSILNDPASEYYNSVLWSAPVEKGTRDDNVKFIYANRPIMSGETLLEAIKPLFNARYGVRTIGGVTTLLFERRDALNTGIVWVDPMQLKAENRLVGELCYSWSDDAMPAYAVIGFSEDGMDEPGNEARDFYKNVFEWNQPFNPVQKGEKQVQFRFGMLRNRRDGIGGDILDSYTWFPSLATPINQYGHAMMVSRGIAGLPKVLVWNGDINDGEVKRYYDPQTAAGWPYSFGKPPAELYNYPFNVSSYATNPNTGYPSNAPGRNLYGRFHAIDNPKVMATRGITFKFEFEYTDVHLSTMNAFAEVPLPVAGGIMGHITSITINHKKRTILVAGKA